MNPSLLSHGPRSDLIAILDAGRAAARAAPQLIAQACAGMLGHAAGVARDRGYVALQLGCQQSADVLTLARLHAAIAQQSVRDGRPMAPIAMISAGVVEAVPQSDGAAAHFLLGLALALDEHCAMHAAACSLDGEGADTPRAGASVPVEGAAGLPAMVFLEPQTLARARARDLAPAQFLQEGKAAEFFRLLEADARLPDANNCVAALPGKPPPTVLRVILILQD